MKIILCDLPSYQGGDPSPLGGFAPELERLHWVATGGRDLRDTVEIVPPPGWPVLQMQIRARCPMRDCRSRPDLADLAGRCSWPPALRFTGRLDERDGRLRTVDEQRTREDEQHQGGDDDGKEQAIHRSQAMAAGLVPRRAWAAPASR
jgi:hypothetical protein